MRKASFVRATVVALVLLLLMTSTAFAQAAGPATAGTTEDRTEEAKGLFAAGKASFDAGRYNDARDYFTRSHAISGKPGLLYNIALAADRAREDDAALEAYEKYLTQVPDAENRAEVERRVTALREAKARREATLAKPEAAPAPEPVAPEPAAEAPAPIPTPDLAATGDASQNGPRDATRPSLAQWIAVGASGAVLVTGGVLLGLALSDKSTVENAEDGTRLDAIEAAHDRVPTFSTVGGILLGAGVAGLAASITWIVIDAGNETRGGNVALRVGPGVVQLEGRL
jgi:tetratricopeptide (TPR) repeat protein